MQFRLLQNITIGILLVIGHPLTGWTNATEVYSSQDQQVSLMEVYVSEGCSSCPPAQKWISHFMDDPRLWKEVIPVVFHVDYWDYLGWKDPFSSDAYTRRQYRHQSDGNIGSVYTPGFVVNGSEWRGWFQKKKLPVGGEQAGQLNARLESETLNVNYEGSVSEPVLNIVILGFDIHVDVKSGENRNRTLKEDFVVLAHEIYQSQNGQWSIPIPAYSTHSAQRYAIALWVNRKEDLTPLQATGGWLK